MSYIDTLKSCCIELHEDLRYCYEDGSIDFCSYFKTTDGSELINIWVD